MATSNYPGLTKSLNYALPALTILLGATGIFGGYSHTTNPTEASKLGGFPVSSPTSPTSTDRALFRAIGARNISSGIGLLALTGMYGLARLEKLPVASTTIKRCLGVLLLIGVSTGLADGALLVKYADEVGGEEAKEYREKGAGHTLMSGVIALLGLGWAIV